MTYEEFASDLLRQRIVFTSAEESEETIKISVARTRVAKRAQEYIEENYNYCVRIEDLCRTTDVGVRTLQRCFKEYFDVTISEYLKTVRLDAAYRSLDASQTEHSTVAAIALQHGFTHLGRFSVVFRERFGESPSAILAK
jgi:transcriptional regulator GlxA family with amidase domain